jgi:GMP synthase-like glutamine amidotransferase
MRLHIVQHVEFEPPSAVALFAAQKNFRLTKTCFHKNQSLPDMASFDALVILGGPMSVGDEEKFPWLTSEKKFIAMAIQQNKTVLGICLGAQLIAEVLGGEVCRHTKKEIGWFPVTLTPAGKKHPLLQGVPEEFLPMHWHSDTFSIPKGAQHLASSHACVNQAFVYGERVVGLQFHLEFDLKSIERLISRCGDELDASETTQTPSMLLNGSNILASNKLLQTVLSNLLNK